MIYRSSLFPTRLCLCCHRNHLPGLVRIPLRVAQHRQYATPVDNPKNDNDRDTEKENGNPATHDPELISLLHSYPVHRGASPYEVMGFKGHWDCETAALKKRFHQLAKIYHPDSSAFDGACLAKKTFFNSNETESAHDGKLTNSLKAQRFKRILSAYSLLKNPLTKSNYDDYRVGWEDNSIGMHRSPNPNYHNPNSAFYRNMGRTKSAHGNTGTWEDYWDTSGATYGFTGDSSWQAEGETFSEHFQNNRKNIFISVALFLAVYAALQATHLYMFDNYIGEEYGQTYSSEEIQDRSERDLVDARVNYGLGLTKEDRINRFLWFRQISMLLSLGDINTVKEHMLGLKLLIHDQDTGRVRIREYENKKLMKHRQEKQPETVGEKTVGASIEEAAEGVTKEAAEAGEATTATSS